MRKYYDQITRIAGNVVTVKARNVGYDELAVLTSDRGSSLAASSTARAGLVTAGGRSTPRASTSARPR